MVCQDQIQQIIMLTNLTEGKQVIFHIYFLISQKSVNCMFVMFVHCTAHLWWNRKHHLGIMIIITVCFHETTKWRFPTFVSLFSKVLVINCLKKHAMLQPKQITQYVYIFILKVKCYQYWPNNGKIEIYGTISVEVIEEKVYAFFIKRRFKVSQLEVSNEL